MDDTPVVGPSKYQAVIATRGDVEFLGDILPRR